MSTLPDWGWKPTIKSVNDEMRSKDVCDQPFDALVVYAALSCFAADEVQSRPDVSRNDSCLAFAAGSGDVRGVASGSGVERGDEDQAGGEFGMANGSSRSLGTPISMMWTAPRNAEAPGTANPSLVLTNVAVRFATIDVANLLAREGA